MKRIERIPIVIVAILWAILIGSVEGIAEEKENAVEWTIKAILFEGNHYYPDGKLREMMKLEDGDIFRQWQLDEDLEAIESFYRKNGFIGFSVEDIERFVDVRKREITIQVILSEGRRIIFREIKFEGNTLMLDRDLRKRLELESGEPFHAVKIDRLLQEMTDYYAAKGHIRLEATSQSRISADSDSVDVVITIDEGPRIFIRDVYVEGNEHVSEEIVRRGSRLHRGDLITPKRLQESQQSIYQINMFKNVSLTLDDTEVPDSMDVRISVRESEFKTFGVGGGYGSVDGIKASFEWNQYQIFSKAEAIRTRSEITYQPFELSRINFSNAHAIAFTQPFFFRTLIRAQWSLSYKISDYQTYNQEVASFKGLFTRAFGFQRRLSLLVDFNSTKIFDVDPEQASDDVRENEGRQVANSLTLTYVLDKRRNLFYPESKDLLTLESTLSGGPLLGEVNFYRFTADYSRYLLISEDYFRPVLAGRIKAGVVRGFQTGGAVLPGEQFSIGGANSLRGYKEQSIGPLGDEGDPNTHSGNHLLLLNLEARFTIWKKIGAVVFFDSGNVYDEDFKPRSPFLLTSFGAGIRYKSPIGPIRLEGALRLDRDITSGVGRIHFSVGQAF